MFVVLRNGFVDVERRAQAVSKGFCGLDTGGDIMPILAAPLLPFVTTADDVSDGVGLMPLVRGWLVVNGPAYVLAWCNPEAAGLGLKINRKGCDIK